jgi:N-acetylmuramoyl-L-alanine amidase
VPVDEAGFLAAAARFGYPVEDGLAAVLGAVRLRFRPWASGALAPEDMGAITDLAVRFAVDRGGADT